MLLGRTLTLLAAFPCRHAPPRANLFGDFFDDNLKEQTPPKRALLPSLVLQNPTTYTLKEKMFSFSGEDFMVRDVAGNTILQIEGANINLGGMVIDKLGFKDGAGVKFCSVERRILAASTCYDIYSPDGECIAKVEREWLSMTPAYKFYYEGDANPFADFEASGSFADRTYTFKEGMSTIARVRRAQEVVNDVDEYVVEVGPKVDAAAILAMTVIIDEDHDEEDAKRQREGKETEGGGGGWPFG